jgi:hypothetical protein
MHAKSPFKLTLKGQHKSVEFFPDQYLGVKLYDVHNTSLQVSSYSHCSPVEAAMVDHDPPFYWYKSKAWCKPRLREVKELEQDHTAI